MSNQKIYNPLPLCSPRIKLLNFSIWQMNSASILMLSKKNQCTQLHKTKKHRRKPNRMSDAEIIVIFIHFHSGGFRCFKHYYLRKHPIKCILHHVTIFHYDMGSRSGHTARKLIGLHIYTSSASEPICP